MNSRNAYYLTYDTGVSNLALEKVISRDYDYSYIYARDVLKGRFELGEKAISEDSYYSYFYALYAIKGRFRLGEESIMKTNNFRYYFEYLVKGLRYDHE